MKSSKELMQHLEFESIAKFFNDLNKLSTAQAQHNYNHKIMHGLVKN